MYLCHINLSTAPDTARIATLIESLQQHGMRQHVLVRNRELASTLERLPKVSVGPVVRSALVACGLVPDVDIVHIHDLSSCSAGLLLTLTRSVPFVMPEEEAAESGNNPVRNAARKRAAGVVARDLDGASEHIQVYRRAVDSLRIPTMLL